MSWYPLAGAALGTVVWTPQAWCSMQDRDLAGVSLATAVLGVLTGAGWIAYGLASHVVGLWAGTLLPFVSTSVIALRCVTWRLAHRDRSAA